MARFHCMVSPQHDFLLSCGSYLVAGTIFGITSVVVPSEPRRCQQVISAWSEVISDSYLCEVGLGVIHFTTLIVLVCMCVFNAQMEKEKKKENSCVQTVRKQRDGNDIKSKPRVFAITPAAQ